MERDTPKSPLKDPTRPLPPLRSSEMILQINWKELTELTMTELSEKILNGRKMDQELPLPLMLSISDYLDTTFTIPKPMLIWLFLELLLFTILLPLKEDLLHASVLLMMKMMDGNSVPLMMNLPQIGSAPSQPFSDFPALTKKKLSPKKLFTKFNL